MSKSFWTSYDPTAEPAQTTVPQELEVYGVSDFRKDPKVMQAFENVTDYLSQSNFTMLDAGTNPEEDDDPVEFLRDDMMKIESATSKALALKDAPDSVKADYRFLRSRFEKTEIDNIGERARQFMDLGGDALFNYGNATTLALAAITGAGSAGTGTAAVAGGRVAAGKAATKALETVLRAANPTSIKGYAGQGALLGSTAMLGEQNLELSIDERDVYDPSEIAVAGGVGLLAGGGIGYAGRGINKYLNRREVQDANVDLEIEVPEVQVNNVPYTNIQNKTSQEIADELGLSVEEVDSLDQAFITDLLERVNSQVDEVAPNQADLVAALSDDVSKLGLDASEETVAALPSVTRLANAIGGGKETTAKLVDAALAAARQETPGRVRSDLLYGLNKTLSNFTSYAAFGKASGFLSPYSKISPTAKLLQERSSTEFAMGVTPGQKTIQEDYAEAIRSITGSFYKLYIDAVLPISSKRFNTELGEEVNAALSLAVRGQAASRDEAFSQQVNTAAVQIQRAYKAAGRLLKREGFIDKEVKNYIPRQWRRSAIENNADEFNALLVKAGEAKDIADAERIRKGMLEIENQLTGESTDGYFFSSKRSFEKITDDAMFEKFLNTDVKETYYNYMSQVGRALAKKRVFGVRNVEEFKNKWVTQINQEVRAGTGKSLSKREGDRVVDLYKTLTGEGAGKPGNINQGYQLAQRLALLPLATASSLTEILLNLGVAGGSAFAKSLAQSYKISAAKFSGDWNDFADAHKVGFLKITQDNHKKLQDEFGLTPEEAWHEMQSVGLAMEQSLVSMADRIAGGDELTNGAMAWTSNKFFRINLLDQWTKFVQNTSYHAGKNMIRKNLEDIAAHGKAPITRRIQSKMDNLAEFGVDLDEGLKWIRGGADKNAKYYKSVVNGAARYANQIILQPERASGLRPRGQYTPMGSLLTQLMGYPTAFTNNILKRGAKRLVRDKEIAAAQLAPTALLMTAAAGATNYIRSRGEGYEDKDPLEVGYEALARWGGNGLFLDQIIRARESVDYMGVVGIPSGFLGPVYGDVATMFGYRKPLSVMGRKVPGYGAGKTVLGEEAMEEYKEVLSDADDALKEAIVGERIRTPYRKGGEVDVPQAPDEPDERIDKITGRPYNIQAGEAFIDEEDMPKSLLAREI